MSEITKTAEGTAHCGYCGCPIVPAGDSAERFGERFCSDAHAEEFVAGVRGARIAQAAQSEGRAPSASNVGAGCALPPRGERSWGDVLKRGLCWGAPLLVLLAIPLFWTGGWAATGGSLLTVLAFLACPLGMYFMMRGMTGIHQDGRSAEVRPRESDRG